MQLLITHYNIIVRHHNNFEPLLRILTKPIQNLGRVSAKMAGNFL